MLNKKDIDNFERKNSQYIIDEKLDRFYTYNEDDFILDDKIMEYYNALLEKITFLIKEMNFKDHIDISHLYNLMLWDGLFSHGSFKFRKYNRYDNTYLLGANVMFGEGACVNTAVLFTDILNKLGFEAYTISCRVKSNEPDIEEDEKYFVPSKPNFKETIHLALNELMCGANHAVTGVLIDGRLDLIDSINGEYAYLSEYNVMEYLSNHQKARLNQNDVLYLNLGMNEVKLRKIFLDSLRTDFKLTRKDVVSSRKVVKEFYTENQWAFDWMKGYLSPEVAKVNDRYVKIKEMSK